MSRAWPALVVEAPALDDPADAGEWLAALLDDFAPIAIEDRAEQPLPPGGLWDATDPQAPLPAPTPLHWRVFFADAGTRDAAWRAIAEALPTLRVSGADVPDEDWAARSQASLTAVSAGRFVVAPPWDIPAAVPAGAHLIVIEPSMGFGTGHHESTRLCLRLLSEVDVTGRSVLDLGTGSGVLAMAAALSGARAVDAVDADADAVASAEHSAAKNPLPPVVRFRVADFRRDQVDAADVTLANLTGGLLVSSASAICRLVKPGGSLIVSGFGEDEVEAVRGAFGGLTETSRLGEDTWRALRLDRR